MKKISRIMEIISGIFFLACGGYVILNIITRTLFNKPLAGVYEMTGLFAIVFAASSIVICIMEDGNVCVDVIVDKLPPKAKLVLKYFSHAVELIYYALLAWGAWEIGIAKLLGNELTTTVKFPIGPFRVYWAVAASLLVVVKVVKIIRAKHDFAAAQRRKDSGEPTALPDLQDAGKGDEP